MSEEYIPEKLFCEKCDTYHIVGCILNRGDPFKLPLKPNHKWDRENLNTYGNDRCSKCGMQHRYYLENIATLKTWSKEEKKDPEWIKLIRGMMICEPRGRNKL